MGSTAGGVVNKEDLGDVAYGFRACEDVTDGETSSQLPS